MKIIGHRGARGLAPENTMASLKKAEEHGVDEIEFDLRVTKDNVVVLDHDGVITDPNGNKHKISENTYKLLKEHKPDLTKLEEVLNSDLKTPFYVEIKSDELLGPIIKEFERTLANNKRTARDLRFASFDQKILLELHAAFPDVQIIINEKWSGIRASRRGRQLGTKRVSMNQKWLWPGFIKSVKRRGWELYAYTLNDPKKAAKWQKHGLAGVITDYPDLYQK